MLTQIVLILFLTINLRPYSSDVKSEWEPPGKSLKTDVLCLAEVPTNYSFIWKNTPVLSWCGNWPLYFHLLEDNILRGTQTVVLVQASLFHQHDFLTPIEGTIGNFPGVQWMLISDRKKSMQGQARLCTIQREESTDDWKFAPGMALHCELLEKADAFLGKRQVTSTPMTSLFSKRFRHAKHKIARFVDVVYNNITCTTPFEQSLSALNVSVQYMPINYPNWIATFIERRIEALDDFVVYDLPRSRNLHYTGTMDVSHTILYVKKKFKWSVDITSWEAGKTTVLATTASACAVTAFFCLLSWSKGTNPMRDIPRVSSALLASIVSFPAAFPHSCMSRQPGRLVFAFWGLSMVCLSNYIQALLTTSVSAGMKLDLDDTREKLSPKIKSQEMRVCALSGSYASTILAGGPGESEFVRDMRLVLDITSPLPSSPQDDEAEMCLEKVDKGTHVFLTHSDIDCSPGVGEKYAFAKETFGMWSVTFPVSKESIFKAEFEYLIGRTFETGWPHFACTPYPSWKICYPALKSFSARIMLVPQQLFSLYMHCIFISCVVLLLEILTSGSIVPRSCRYR